MITELEQIIQTEEAKPEAERDVDLIDDCIREIAKLKGVRAEYSDEEIDRITDNLVKATEREKKQKRFIRLAAGVAAAFVIISGVTACAINPALINWFAKEVRMPFGDTISSDTITYTNQGITQEYNNIKAFLESEELDVYYPSILPDNTHLISIDHVQNKSQDYYLFFYSTPRLYYTIEAKTAEREFCEELVAEIDQNNLHFDIYKDIYENAEIYFGICEIDELRYVIQCDNMHDLIILVGGLKKEHENY
jgi:hypothetical protein